VQLVADASVLVGEALRARGRALLGSALFEFVISEDAWEETQYELRRRVALIAVRRAFPPGRDHEVLADALDGIALNASIVPPSTYQERQAEARQRMARDPDDAPTLALALTLDSGIWTSDRDFFGCGIPVWSTETLLWYLRSEASP
jgi:hypothetical protein